MDLSIHELFTDRVFNAEMSVFNAEMSVVGKRFAAELLAEDPTRTAQQLVDLLREEADAADVELKQLRGDN